MDQFDQNMKLPTIEAHFKESFALDSSDLSKIHTIASFTGVSTEEAETYYIKCPNHDRDKSR